MAVEKIRDLIGQLENDEERSDKTDSMIRRLEAKQTELGGDAAEEQADGSVEERIAEAVDTPLNGGSCDDSQEFMETATAAVTAFFDKRGWRYSKFISRPDIVVYQLGFNLQNCNLNMRVYIEESPRACRIDAILPITADKTYEYLLCEAIVKINYDKRFGAFYYDESTGEVSYRYSFPIAHGVYMDELEQVFSAVQHTAAANYAEIVKHCVGKYKIKEITDILKKTDALVTDLNDDGV